MKTKRSGSLLICAGLLLIAAALSLAAFNLWDEYRASQTVVELNQQLVLPDPAPAPVPDADAETPPVTVPEEQPAYILNPEMEMPVTTLGRWDYIGTLDFPARDKTVPVISELSDAALRSAPCRYEGSAYTGDLIIAGHNYRSHLAHLRRLEIGEEVRFIDVEGNVFSYSVVEREVLDGTAIEAMSEGDWDMTMFTCTLGGQQRITIRCVLNEPF